MWNPAECVGKIVTSFEKFYDPVSKRIRVKKRPVLIIGFEDNYSNYLDVDFELLPISKIEKSTPHPTYDVLISGDVQKTLKLHQPSYIRSHKITWSHAKNTSIESPMSDLKELYPDMFDHLLSLNQQWVEERNSRSLSYEPAVND